LTQGTKGSEILYLSVNPNGEAETVTVHLRAAAKIKKLKWDLDFAELAVRARSARGNTVSKNSIKRIEMKSEGVSTLAARKLWFDDAVLKINDQERGRMLGAFRGEDRLLQLEANGRYRIFIPELATHFEEAPFFLAKWEAEKPYAIVYYDGEKGKHMVKRCVLEPKNDQWDYLISDNAQSEVQVISAADQVDVEVTFKKVKGKDKDPETVNLQDFIAVKGWKAAGNQLTTWPVKGINVLREENEEAPIEDMEVARVLEDAEDRSESKGTDEAPSTHASSPVEQDQPAAPSVEEKSAPEKPSITLEVVDLTASEPPAASEASEEDDSDQEEDGQFTLKF
jgi:topoisomerase-4 subunit A